MRKVLLVLGMFLIPSLGSAQVQITDDFVRQQMFAMVKSHPDTGCRMQMTEWLTQGKVILWPSLDTPSLALKIIQDASGKLTSQVALMVNPAFFFSTYLPPEDRVNNAVSMEKYGAIYHEYVHLLYHFNGTYSLAAIEADQTAAVAAKFYWGSELEAYWAEYKFLLSKGFGNLFFQGQHNQFREYSGWERFLRVFYDRLQNGKKGSPRYKPYWEKYFQEALKHPRL